jgi:MFS family permease
MTADGRVARLVAGSEMLRSLRHRDFRLFWVGLGLALTGFQVQRVGMGFLAYDLTGSALYLTLVFAGDSIPMMLLAPIGGVFVDRLDRKRLLMLTRSGIAVLALIVTALTLAGRIEAWHLLVCSLLSGVLYAFDIPTRQAMIRDLVPEDDLVNAIALSQSIIQGARIVGPAIGGVALALVGVSGTFVLWAIGQLGLVVMVGLMGGSHKARAGTASALANLTEGFRFIARQETILVLLLMSAVPALFAMSYQSLTPVFAQDVLGQGKSQIGTMLAAAGVGALAGSVVVAASGERFNRPRVAALAAIIFSLIVTAFALSPVYLLSLGLLVLTGAAGAVYSVVNSSVVQTSTPREMQGRVMGVYQLTWNVQLFGSLLVGALADAWGAPPALALAGMVSAVAVAALLLLRPSLRRAGEPSRSVRPAAVPRS